MKIWFRLANAWSKKEDETAWGKELRTTGLNLFHFNVACANDGAWMAFVIVGVGFTFGIYRDRKSPTP